MVCSKIENYKILLHADFTRYLTRKDQKLNMEVEKEEIDENSLSRIHEILGRLNHH